MREFSKYCKIGLLLSLLCLTYILSQAQTILYNNLKSIKVSTKASTILDTLSIEPSTIVIEGYDTSCYNFSLQTSEIQFKPSCTLPDSVIVYYRHFPMNLGIRQKNPQYNFDSNFVFKIYDQDAASWYQKSPLTYSGSYSRNMQVGNSQDMSMNSNFNLQVNGYLLDSIYIEGAITDNQLPFQPDGNTQQVQEFDRIYIILQKNKHKITFGDFNLDKNDAYFLRFNKRAQGVFYQGLNKKWGKTTHDYGISASMSKGQYARNQFQGIEGNQGPYKLVGNNGETFFIILAGTEKVYVDGVLLTRGEDKDYIINYNTSEIIFMPRQLITKDKRIQVEFEYQDRNYLNSLIYAYDNIQVNEKLNVNISLYSNQDAKNQPYLQELNAAQKNFLYDIGDSIHNAYFQNIQPEAFAPNKILYIQKDTTITSTGETYSGIYEYSTDSTQTLYSLGFSYVGEQKGDYIISSENANGRSYQWIAPIDGISQGSYNPVTLLITPKMHQVYNVGVDYSIDKNKKLKAEVSASVYDPNLFSPKGNETHLGIGSKIDYSEKRIIGQKDSVGMYKHSIDNEVNYEYLQHNYRAISPFRNLEFARDWNILDIDQTPVHQHLGHIKSQYNWHKKGHAYYKLAYFNQEKQSEAYKNTLEIQYNPENTLTRLHADMLNSNSQNFTSQFLRPHAVIERTFQKLAKTKVGSRWELEHNEVYNQMNDSLTPYSFSFDTWTTYVQNDQADLIHWDIKYIQRRERLVDSTQLQLNNIGHNIESRLSLANLDNHQLDVSIGYRYLELFDTNKISAVNAGGSILGRINYSGNFKEGFLVPTIQYEFGNGQEQKKEYIYVEVPAGQGLYYWVDYNEDGVQQANEFEMGIYPDQKRFIRILTPTNEYIGMSYYILQSSVSMNFSKLFPKKATGLGALLSKINNQFSIQSNSKIINDGTTSLVERYIPLTQKYDSLIINQNLSMMNTLFFNRSNTKWGLDFSVFLTENKTLLTYGLETQRWQRQILSGRWLVTPSLTSQMKYTWGDRSYFSGVNDGRTYNFNQRSYAPSLSYIYGQNWRITTTYTHDRKINEQSYGGEEAYINNLTADMRFSFKKLGSLQSSLTYSNIKFTGSDRTAVSLIMLDALKNGNNMLWNLQWNTMLTKGIEMSIIYEGRKPANTPLIHTGNMTIRAIL